MGSGRLLKKPLSPDEMVERLMRPATRAMNHRAKLLLEAAGKAAANLALEQAAQIAERAFVEVHADAPAYLKERFEYQNTVAKEIASRIRDEMVAV